MDPELLSTCKQGDVENLKKLCEIHRHDYEFFLTRQASSYNQNMLHLILQYDEQRPSFIKEALELLPNQVVRQLICLPDSNGDNPLHQAAYGDRDNNARLLVAAYNGPSDVVDVDDLSSCPPWRAKNKLGKVPAEVALSCNRDEVAAFLISVDPDIFTSVDANKLLCESILQGCIRTVIGILTSNYGYGIEGFDTSHIDNECLSEDRCVSFLQHHPNIANYLDPSGKTEVLDRAIKIGAVDVVKTILNFDISNSYTLLIRNDDKGRNLIADNLELVRFKDASRRSMLEYLVDEDRVDAMITILVIDPWASLETQNGEHEHLLMRVCRMGKLSTIHALLPKCPSQDDIYSRGHTTILHNVGLLNLREYQSLLDIPEIARFKNKTDKLGRTPLIKAIHDNKVCLAQALVDMDGVDFMKTRNEEGKTAAVLLEEKSKESAEWDAVYKKVKQEILGIHVSERRSTISVVAALLATITFTAAFTVLDSFDQNNGDVLLRQRTSFIVFILSDTYAMCCSMNALYSLTWFMVFDLEKDIQMTDRSVSMLHQSFYGTLVAFMTGVYTVLSRKTLWVAIVVCVMCSCVLLSASRKILITQLYKFIPTSRSGSNVETELSIQP